MAKRFTDTEKYRKKFFRGLPGAYKLFWDFLYHECNHAGIWHVDFDVAQIYLGRDMPVSEETALRLFNEGEDRITVISNGSKWFIRPFIEFQYKAPLEQLNPANKVHASILSQLIKEGACKPHASPMQGAKDKDKDKDGVDVKKGSLRGNIPPTAKDVQEYAAELGFVLDGEGFCDYYEARGWKFKGGQPMKNWKATVRTWKKNNFNPENAKAATLDFN